MSLLPNTKKEILDALNEKLKGRKTRLKCPFCNQTNFNLIDGYSRKDLGDSLKEVHIGGLNVPTVSVVCTNCGYLFDFALGTLGLLSNGKKETISKEQNGKK
jgi:hypothetical protein